MNKTTINSVEKRTEFLFWIEEQMKKLNKVRSLDEKDDAYFNELQKLIQQIAKKIQIQVHTGLQLQNCYNSRHILDLREGLSEVKYTQKSLNNRLSQLKNVQNAQKSINNRLTQLNKVQNVQKSINIRLIQLSKVQQVQKTINKRLAQLNKKTEQFAKVNDMQKLKNEFQKLLQEELQLVRKQTAKQTAKLQLQIIQNYQRDKNYQLLINDRWVQQQKREQQYIQHMNGQLSQHRRYVNDQMAQQRQSRREQINNIQANFPSLVNMMKEQVVTDLQNQFQQNLDAFRQDIMQKFAEQMKAQLKTAQLVKENYNTPESLGNIPSLVDQVLQDDQLSKKQQIFVKWLLQYPQPSSESSFEFSRRLQYPQSPLENPLEYSRILESPLEYSRQDSIRNYFDDGQTYLNNQASNNTSYKSFGNNLDSFYTFGNKPRMVEEPRDFERGDFIRNYPLFERDSFVEDFFDGFASQNRQVIPYEEDFFDDSFVLRQNGQVIPEYSLFEENLPRQKTRQQLWTQYINQLIRIQREE